MREFLGPIGSNFNGLLGRARGTYWFAADSRGIAKVQPFIADLELLVSLKDGK